NSNSNSLAHFDHVLYFSYRHADPRDLHSFPTRRSSDLISTDGDGNHVSIAGALLRLENAGLRVRSLIDVSGTDTMTLTQNSDPRSEEHTSELQSPDHLVCRLLLEKKKIKQAMEDLENMN